MRRLGGHGLDRIEDAVQTAMLRALESWKRDGPPDKPEAWLYQVAYNAYIEGRRRDKRQRLILDQQTPSAEANGEEPHLAHADDAMVRMLLVCCHELLSLKSSLVLALKTLCGLGIPEIARRLFESESNVYKLSQRARATLGRRTKAILELSDAQVTRRLPSLYRVLYALFCEGYNSLAGEVAIRAELCAEAIRLGRVVAATPPGQDPQLFALLATMHFGAARLPGRIGASGELLLLQDQNRSKWDQGLIATGMSWLEKSASGPVFSRYHAEAGVAAEHCRATTLRTTDWQKIVDCYDLLAEFENSAMNRLDRIVAIAELRGAAVAREEFTAVDWSKDLRQSYLWLSVAGELERRVGNHGLAESYSRRAMAAAPTSTVRDLIISATVAGTVRAK